MATTTLIITSSMFSPNPVELGSSTKLSVTVQEIVITPYTREITLGLWTSGQA